MRLLIFLSSIMEHGDTCMTQLRQKYFDPVVSEVYSKGDPCAGKQTGNHLICLPCKKMAKKKIKIIIRKCINSILLASFCR